MEQNITIDCDTIKLESALHINSSQKTVIITHPHPLYGGNMDNPVVMTIAESFFEKGFTTLRFNFRGTGNSTGKFDDGNGEQEDIRAALSFLKEQKNNEIYLAGYSFGARMNASVVSNGCEIEDHIMVSPPMGFMSFDTIEKMPNTGLIVTGERDDIAPVDVVQGHIKRWQITPVFKVIENGDHFYSGSLGKLKTILTQYLSCKGGTN
ncbi:MAG: alpha/beta hydrolase [Desulfobacteraceae bacterium]|nr:alpha/beta hydrolase [Desulfobacteraceae bacterium]